jgi:acyl CoA:acetate/3-ketoacid CoA transferase alpha subunit
LDTPSADISMIRARRTSECGKLRERAIAANCSPSAALTATTLLGLPMRQYYTGLAPVIK